MVDKKARDAQHGGRSIQDLPKHHPYRIEVHDLNPVSVTFLISLRPPPISLLHERRRAARVGASEGSTSAATHSQEGTSRLPARTDRTEDDDWPSDDGHTAVDPTETPARIAEAGTSNGADASGDVAEEARHQSHENGQTSQAIASTSQRASVGTSAIEHLLEEGMTVLVDGQPWKHVLMSDSGNNAGEAIIVVFGLRPGQPAKVELCVGSEAVNRALEKASKLKTGQAGGRALENGNHETESIEMQTRAGGEAKHLGTFKEGTLKRSGKLTNYSIAVAIRSISPTPSRTISSTAAPAESANHAAHVVSVGSERDLANAVRISSLKAELAAANETKNTLSAEVRKARKEASRAESALRNEIEAVKRGLDRMSGTDHRSKQKLLALQESIRQANMQAEEYDEEASTVESGLEEWKQKENALLEKYSEAKKLADERDKELSEVQKDTHDVISSKEREVEKTASKLGDIQAKSLKLKQDSIAALMEELKSLEEEIDKVNKAPVDITSESLPGLQQQPARGAFQHQQSFTGNGKNNSLRGRGSGRFGRGGRAKHGNVANAVGPSLPSGSDPVLAVRSASHPIPTGSQQSSYALNPNNPEFVPSSVLLAQAAQQQQPHREQHLVNSNMSSGGFMSTGRPSPHAVPGTSFAPFAPMRSSPPTSETQHSSPSLVHTTVPFSQPESHSVGPSSRWPTTSAPGPIPDFAAVQAASKPTASSVSPWASPLLSGRRGSGLLPPVSQTASTSSSSPLLTTVGKSGPTEKDIWSNPASSRSGNNIWGPLAGFGSSAATTREPGTTGSGSADSGDLRGTSNSGAGFGSYQASPPASFAQAHPSFGNLIPGGSSNSAPQSPVVNNIPSNGFSWERPTREQRGSDGSTGKLPSPIQPPSQFQLGAAAMGSGGSPKTTSPTGNPGNTDSPWSQLEDGEGGSGAVAPTRGAPRTFASVAANQ